MRIRELLCVVVVWAAGGACGGDDLDRASTSDGDRPGATSTSLVNAEVSVELWHCGVRPVTFDGRQWLASSSIDQTTAPLDFGGTGTIKLVGPDRATYTDQASATTIDFAPLAEDYAPPPCM